MSQNIITFANALKDCYLPALSNQLNDKPTPFLAKIKKVALEGDTIVTSMPVGFSGGVGFGAEGQATPKSGAVRMERFTTASRDMYGTLIISQKVVDLSKTGSAMANALDIETDGLYKAAKWNLGRSLLGNGTGILTTSAALSSAGNTIEVADTKYLAVGITIDIYATGGTEPQPGGNARRILDIDKTKKTILIDGEPSTFLEGFITVQNSYNREITGLGAIFDDSITHLYGVAKKNNNFIKPTVVDANQDISDDVITDALMTADDEKGAEIDTIMCGRNAYKNYVAYLRVNNIRVEDQSHTIQGGFKAIKHLYNNKIADIVYDRFVPDNEMWGVDSKKFEFHHTDWHFATLKDSDIFTLLENQSAYRALLVNYGDLICKHPGGCIRITNCA